MAYTVADLLKMPQGDLDALFTSSPPGPIPDGESNGTAIISPGTVYSADIATMVNHFAWQGKVFDAKAGLLRNRVGPMGVNAIVAKVSFVAHWIRDEIRMIGPGLYLGVVYWAKSRLIHFALQF
jgi:hypothetical protein